MLDWIWKTGWRMNILLSTAAVAFASWHDLKGKRIVDYVHDKLPIVPSELPNFAVIVLVLAAIKWGRRGWEIFDTVYSRAMLIKATLIVLTLIPDANPDCDELHPLRCMTRNDMLPSGHMLAALCAALILNHPLAYLAAGICGVLLVTSRMHYSSDVILSTWLVLLLNKIRGFEYILPR